MNRKSRIAFGPGAASLILIVVVLCMSVLGVLSLMNAHSDNRFSDRSVEVIAQNYALSAEAERSLAALDAVAARCASTVESDDEYLLAVNKWLPEGMELVGREVSWTETDGVRTLDCAAEIAPLGEGTRLRWTRHRLTSIMAE